jgi:small conductance mechanosensitive channel
MENFKIDNAVNIVVDKLQEWLEALIAMLPNFVVAVLVVIGFYFLARLVKNLTSRLLKKVLDNYEVNKLISNLAYFVVLGIGMFIALSTLELSQAVTSLLAGAGIIGLALGFAFQDIAANFVSGIFLTFRKPFKVGDIIQVQDYLGKVSEIDLRITTLTTFQGLDVLVPNKELFQGIVINYTHTKERRVDLAVGVSYGENLRKVKEITIEAIKKLSGLDTSKEVTLFYNEFGDSSINFTVRFYPQSASQADYLTARSEAIMSIKEAYDENDIMIPFPIRTLDFGIKGGEKLSEMKLAISEGNHK